MRLEPHFFPLIERVNDDRDAVRISSEHGNAVLLAEADYDSLLETAYLFRTPANARRLLEAVEFTHSTISFDTQTRRRGSLDYRQEAEVKICDHDF
ncbi:MAG: type II toxin-antitoxin system prevent-host-death family antitoxin [Propionibacteriaceae bacterium]|nr:type II toxin-antitoxin system prevent-host-death family antitoxin [Propionibacteriaceae bacterium]